MRLEVLAACSARVAQTRKRNEKIAALAECIATLSGDEITIGVPFLAGRLRQGKIGLGYSNLISTKDIDPAGEASLSLGQVDAIFDRIAATSGRGSAGERLRLLGALLGQATAAEQSFLRRLLLGELRRGALESLVVEAVARAAAVPAAVVQRAQMLSADLPAVARAALTAGEPGLRAFDVRLFHPIMPMLAQTAESVDDAFSRHAEAALELKLDGARVQVHKAGDEVRVFSRRLNDVTGAVPEIVLRAQALPAREIILDGETIALGPDGSPLPFQITMRRFGRKLAVERLRAQVPLTSFFFDCLYLDGRSLIDEPTRERTRALGEALPPELVIPRLTTSSPEQASAFLRQALDQGHEGVMVKALDAPYEAGSRGASWLKLKHAHTLDLVVLAAEWGSGRRRGWLSNLHLGARDPASGGFVMLGKTFKGLTDQLLSWQTQQLLERATEKDGHVVWVRPELVVEIAFNDLQASPHYPAGLALRFARVKRYRADKGPDQADTIDTVRAIYQASVRLPKG